MIDTALTYLTEVDSFAAVEYLNQQKDPLAVVNAYAKLVVRLYWEEKNLAAVIAMARAGVQYGLTAAATATDPTAAVELKSMAKGLAYNLASFTWPGWNEPGIVVTPSDLAVGLDAAKVNLRLGNELGKGDLPLSRAYWMLGGHHLAGGHLSDAKACFDQAETQAAAADEEADRLLARGFSALAAILAGSDDSEAQNRLEQVKNRLAQLEQGEDFITQIDTAWDVFASLNINTA